MALPELVDDVLRRFEQRVLAGMLPVTPAFYEGAIEESVPNFGRPQSESVLTFVREFKPDRQELIGRLRKEFPELDAELTEDDIVMEIEEMAREGLQREMVRVGLGDVSARRVAEHISLTITLPG